MRIVGSSLVSRDKAPSCVLFQLQHCEPPLCPFLWKNHNRQSSSMTRLGSRWENFAEEEAAEILARAGKVDSKIAPAETSISGKLSCDCCTGRLRLRFQGFPPVEWPLSIEKLLKIKVTATHLLRWFNAYVQSAVASLIEQFDVVKMKWLIFHEVNWRVNVSCF